MEVCGTHPARRMKKIKDRAEDEIRDDDGEGQRDEQMLDQPRRRWAGQVLRRGSEFIDGRMLRMEVPGRRPRGRARRRFMDGVKDDTKLGGVSAEDWVSWRQLIHFAGACRERPKSEKGKDSSSFF